MLDATATRAVDAMNGIISRHPEGIAIICANNDDMAIAAAKAARDSGNENYANTIFLGFNGDRAACEAIIARQSDHVGCADGVPEMGYKSVEAMVQALNGEEIEPVIDSRFGSRHPGERRGPSGDAGRAAGRLITHRAVLPHPGYRSPARARNG